jgi:hemerythrin superfamily protein
VSAAGEDRKKAADLPEGEVIPVLLEQHVQVHELFAAIKTATGESKQQTFDQLQLLLARHETAEETILGSVARDLRGEGVAKARNEHEDKATHVLAELEKLDVSTAEFTEMLATFAQDVAAHAEQEENEEFPRVPSGCETWRRAAMGRAPLATEKSAPTHAHPAAAGSTAAQYAPGPSASVLDHARDALKKASG